MIINNYCVFYLKSSFNSVIIYQTLLNYLLFFRPTSVPDNLVDRCGLVSIFGLDLIHY
jgi:hypothetical protein